MNALLSCLFEDAMLNRYACYLGSKPYVRSLEEVLRSLQLSYSDTRILKFIRQGICISNTERKLFLRSLPPALFCEYIQFFLEYKSQETREKWTDARAWLQASANNLLHQILDETDVVHVFSSDDDEGNFSTDAVQDMVPTIADGFTATEDVASILCAPTQIDFTPSTGLESGTGSTEGRLSTQRLRTQRKVFMSLRGRAPSAVIDLDSYGDENEKQTPFALAEEFSLCVNSSTKHALPGHAMTCVPKNHSIAIQLDSLLNEKDLAQLLFASPVVYSIFAWKNRRKLSQYSRLEAYVHCFILIGALTRANRKDIELLDPLDFYPCLKLERQLLDEYEVYGLINTVTEEAQVIIDLPFAARPPLEYESSVDSDSDVKL